MRYEFTNADGERIGVIARHTGEFELVAYPEDDPDEGRPLFRLTREEADTVAEILGASIGVVLLLLTLGLAFSTAEFLHSALRHVPSAVLDLLLNAAPGALAGWLLGLDRVGVFRAGRRHVDILVGHCRPPAHRDAQTA